MTREPARVETIVFDMDGTLVESTHAVTAAYHAAVVASGGQEWSNADIVAVYPLGPPAVILGHLLGRRATTVDLERYYAYLSEFAASVDVHDGVAEILTELAGRLPLAVFTGASHVAATLLLDRVGLLDHLAVIVGGDEVERPKPHPDGICRACVLLGADPMRSAYVGDSPLDLEAARRSGAVAVAAAWGHLFDPGARCDFTAQHPDDILMLLA